MCFNYSIVSVQTKAPVTQPNDKNEAECFGAYGNQIETPNENNSNVFNTLNGDSIGTINSPPKLSKICFS